MTTRVPHTTAENQRNGAQLSVSELCVLAGNGLVRMLDTEKQLFCYRLRRTPQGMSREGVSQRYTVMTLLGLHRYEGSGARAALIDCGRVFDALLADLTWVDNIGDLGLLIWLCAKTRPERLEEIYFTLEAKNAPSKFQGFWEGVTMEAAWFLSGLAHATLAGANTLPGLKEMAANTCALLRSNQGNHGFFGHLSRNRSVAGGLRGRIGSFADQVYPIYALAKFGQAFQDASALRSSQKCAEAICRAQGSLGQWWWHYDSLTGRVFQRYPVYSVHQHAMAPLALLAVTDATGLEFSTWINQGLAWITGKNELDCDLREADSNLVWRSVYLGTPIKAYAREFVDFLKGVQTPISASDFKITFECRPYELGWLLYAFAGRERK